MPASRLEAALLMQMRAAGLPAPVLEYRFCPPRRWRFDACYPALKIAIEIEGGQWTDGRHQRGLGFAADCSKYNQAAILGWRLLRFPRSLIESGEALATIEAALRLSPR